MLHNILYIIILLTVPIFYFLIFIASTIWGKELNLNRTDIQQNELPKITVIIPTFNEDKIIAKKINEILAQDYSKDKLEILIIDESIDQTPIIVKKYEKTFPNIVKLIRNNTGERMGLAISLNNGYNLASGDIIIKSDCDAKIKQRNAFQEFATFLSKRNIGAVTSRIVSEINGESNYRDLITKIQIMESNLDSTIIGNMIAFKKNQFTPIDPKSLADDTEILVQIRRKGYRTVIIPQITVEEPRPLDPLQNIKQRSRRAQGIIIVLLKNIKMVFNPKYGKYGFFVFPLNIFLILLSPIILSAYSLFFLYLISSNLLFTLLILAIIGIYLTKIIFFPAIVITPFDSFVHSQICCFIGIIRVLTLSSTGIYQKMR